jgi:hypothetical protein
MATKTRVHTMTMFRDNADTNAVFTQQSKDGDNYFSTEKATDEGDSNTLFTLNNEGFSLLKCWADHVEGADMGTQIVLDGAKDEYQVKISASTAQPDGLKFVKCYPGGKKKTVLVLDDHQAKRFVAWLNRTK